ncbi:PhzF family isomerase [Caproiciproducens sp. NJN-50]|uniref:PhzF family isomerase n=1 Tax=Acutalibacteraceae TaxID=3082771 RepID=UPI000FFE1DD8|nr:MULTISPECIES: PhzF family isomerase [Acutalibacteraceae]QAT49582.1 PhzF family isomerase [Caproiciproducens sp. NJN-50]
MKKVYHIYQIDAFTKKRFTGNPAGVVTNADGLSDLEMQQIARELNNSETAFIITEKHRGYDMLVRFFTPTKEVPICGHATIAAHYANALEKHMQGHTRVLQKTGAGILPVDIYREGDDYRIAMTQGKIQIDEPLPPDFQKQILSALGLEADQLLPSCPIAIASTGHSKVMVGIRRIEQLQNLNPDLSALVRISNAIGCNGYYVFTLDTKKQPLVHGRMFAPAIGIPEDPVTGNANGPLGAYLVHFEFADNTKNEFSFEAVQGEAIGRMGTMTVKVSISDKQPISVQIFGNATIAFLTKIEI